jgi:hypothetical protein
MQWKRRKPSKEAKALMDKLGEHNEHEQEVSEEDARKEWFEWVDEQIEFAYGQNIPPELIKVGILHSMVIHSFAPMLPHSIDIESEGQRTNYEVYCAMQARKYIDTINYIESRVTQLFLEDHPDMKAIVLDMQERSQSMMAQSYAGIPCEPAEGDSIGG